MRDSALAELDRWFDSTPEAEIFRKWRRPAPGLRHVWDGFWDLDDDRTTSIVAAGMGASVIRGGIPYGARSKWLDDHGYQGERRRRILRYWRALDGPYRAAVNGGADDQAEENDDE